MFIPVNKSHAIVEVHFVLDIDRPWLAEDQPLIEEGYKDYWQPILPGRVQGQQILVNLGPQIEGESMGTPPKPMIPMIHNAAPANHPTAATASARSPSRTASGSVFMAVTSG